jgi:hypothetical protein
MTEEEIEKLYLSMINEYMLCKRASHNEALERVRLEVANELKRNGFGILGAAVSTLRAKEKLLQPKKKGA